MPVSAPKPFRSAGPLFRRGVVFRLPSAGATFLSAMGFLVNGSPCSTLGFIFRNTALLVALLDMFGHSLLLVGIAGLSPRGIGPPLTSFSFEQRNYGIVPMKDALIEWL